MELTSLLKNILMMRIQVCKLFFVNKKKLGLIHVTLSSLTDEKQKQQMGKD